MIRLALLLAAAAVAGGSDVQRDVDNALAGRVAGKPVRCLSSAFAGAPQIIGDRTLLYHDGTRIWRNDLPDACAGLAADPIVVNEMFGGQMCRGDTFHTVERGGVGIPGPFCRLGDFTPWERVKR